MNKRNILSLMALLASPTALIVLGLILLFSPDSASALIATVLGWCVFAVGIGFAVSAVAIREGMATKVVGALFCFSVGSRLLRNPLALAAGTGRFIGLLLLVRGGSDFFQSNYGHGRALALVTAALGVVLIVLPMTTSRLIFALCGLVVLATGVVMLIDRLRYRTLPPADDDPNIIDAL